MMSHLGSEHAERDGQMSFADAGRAEEDHVASLMQKSSGGEFVDQAFVDRGLFAEVEDVEAFLIRR